MKRASIYLEGMVLELYSSWTGKVRVVINGECVSERRGIFRGEHRFRSGGKNFRLHMSPLPCCGAFDLYCDEIPLVEAGHSGCLPVVGIFLICMVLLHLLWRWLGGL
ncbi:MAG: hypothetical protein IT266_03400 [Saprospiraceae bacterium]|nr:hypothetical protein [Saprospiraceae bacterium]